MLCSDIYVHITTQTFLRRSSREGHLLPIWYWNHALISCARLALFAAILRMTRARRRLFVGHLPRCWSSTNFFVPRCSTESCEVIGEVDARVGISLGAGLDTLLLLGRIGRETIVGRGKEIDDVVIKHVGHICCLGTEFLLSFGRYFRTEEPTAILIHDRCRQKAGLDEKGEVGR